MRIGIFLKKYILLIFILNINFSYGQFRSKNLENYDKKPINFGFSLGFNTMDFNVQLSKNLLLNKFDSSSKVPRDVIYSINVEKQTGININIVSNLRIFEFLDLRFMPGIELGQRNLIYKIYDGEIFREHIMEIESIFMEVPLLLKFKAMRDGNYSPYLIAGINYRIDWASKKKIREEEKPKIRLNRNDYYFEFGVGIDYYLPFFKLSTEIKLSVGQNNMVNFDNTPHSDALDFLHSRIWVFAFHFE